MRNLIFVCLLWGVASCSLTTAPESIPNGLASAPGVSDYAIASAHPLATRAGIEILRQGGNAFDAAVAVTACLAVVEPYASGLGGGGFWLLHKASERRDVMLDGRERAPLAATRDMYLDEAGRPTRASVVGPLSAGIPGVPAALVHLSDKYGSLSLDTTLRAAIRLAREGFEVSTRYQELAGAMLENLHEAGGRTSVFLDQGRAPEPGYVLRQAQLARVLERIRDEGRDGFYRGEVAALLVQGVREAGGIWQLQDLAEYRVVERAPVSGSYAGMKVTSAALPSSGGIVLMQMLNMLSLQDLEKMDPVQQTHSLVEVMRRTYRDRARYLGDTDFVEVPAARLLSMRHARKLLTDFSAKHATSSRAPICEGADRQDPGREEGRNTTHFSVIDRHGNYVAATLSINYPFGSGFMPPGTGVLLNNEMDDFSVKPGQPNLYGLTGDAANSIEPGKRMLSSMSPTFLDDGERVAILGTPGGSRIITMMLLAAMEFADGADAQAMVSRPRFHHQFMPDLIQFESEAFDDPTQAALAGLGHRLQVTPRSYGDMHALIWNRGTGQVTAASDPRGIGHAQVGE